MVVETIHVMDADETPSEAVKNYAHAAYLFGMAVLTLGIGAGIIAQSVKNIRKKSSSSIPEDLLDEIRRRTHHTKVGDAVDATRDVAVESLRRTVEDILGGNSKDHFEQITAKTFTTYYVRKTYKKVINVGDLIPTTAIVERPATMTDEQFMKMDNLKFRTKTTTMVGPDMAYVTVEEILNSEPVKPV